VCKKKKEVHDLALLGSRRKKKKTRNLTPRNFSILPPKEREKKE